MKAGISSLKAEGQWGCKPTLVAGLLSNHKPPTLSERPEGPLCHSHSKKGKISQLHCLSISRRIFVYDVRIRMTAIVDMHFICIITSPWGVGRYLQ